jgi:Arc/MetJ family transcription regulator
MATVNFSVPDEVKVAFDKAFSAQNKSAIVADLMRRAVRESVQRRRREQLFQQLCADRSRRPATSSPTVRKARNADRP